MPFYFHCSKPAIAKSFRLARFGSRARLCRRSSAEVSARDLPANCSLQWRSYLLHHDLITCLLRLLQTLNRTRVLWHWGATLLRACARWATASLDIDAWIFNFVILRVFVHATFGLNAFGDMFPMVFAHWTCFEVFIDGKHDFKSVSGRVFCLYMCRTFGTYWNAWHDRLNRIYIIGSRAWSLDVLWPGMTTEPWFNFWLAAQFPFVALLSVCEANVNTIDD